MISLKNTEQASAVYALIFAALFAFLSFYGTDAETYLFPRIIAIILAIFSSTFLLVSGSTSRTGGYQGFMRQSMTMGAVRPT